MKVKLSSDFRDYYDHQFDLFGDDLLVYNRQSRGGMNKPEQMIFLSSLGFHTPLAATVSELIDELTHLPHRHEYTPRTFVIYDDITSHAGADKRLVLESNLSSDDLNRFATIYLGTGDTPTTLRWLQIGKFSFILRYTSDDAWRSNCGNVNIEVLACKSIKWSRKQIPHPLFAIDFLEFRNGDKYAIDFNIAPGIKGTGVENFLSPTDIVDEIITYFSAKTA